MYCKETKLQMARQTRVRGLLWYDSTINNAKNHFLRPELNALISIRKDAALAERPPALFRANVRCRPSAVSVGIMLQRCRLSMHGTSGEDIEIGTLTANNALVSNSTATTFVLRVRIRTGNDTPRQSEHDNDAPRFDIKEYRLRTAQRHDIQS